MNKFTTFQDDGKRLDTALALNTRRTAGAKTFKVFLNLEGLDSYPFATAKEETLQVAMLSIVEKLPGLSWRETLPAQTGTNFLNSRESI